jgi:hypothetical protein
MTAHIAIPLRAESGGRIVATVFTVSRGGESTSFLAAESWRDVERKVATTKRLSCATLSDEKHIVLSYN